MSLLGACWSALWFCTPLANIAPTKKPPTRGGFFTTIDSYNLGPAALIASLTSNFLKFSMNRPASAFAASS